MLLERIAEVDRRAGKPRMLSENIFDCACSTGLSSLSFLPRQPPYFILIIRATASALVAMNSTKIHAGTGMWCGMRHLFDLACWLGASWSLKSAPWSHAILIAWKGTLRTLYFQQMSNKHSWIHNSTCRLHNTLLLFRNKVRSWPWTCAFQASLEAAEADYASVGKTWREIQRSTGEASNPGVGYGAETWTKRRGPTPPPRPLSLHETSSDYSTILSA